MFLQSIAVDPARYSGVSDSLKIAAETIMEKAKSDPDVFMKELVGKFIDFGLKLVAALIIYAIGAWLIRRIRNGVERRFERRNTEKTLATFVTSLVSITLTLLLITLTIATLGINTTSLAALLAAGGMAVGMALSGTVSNFAGGIMLLIFKPFKAGDFINAQGYSGTVREVTIVNTKIVTTDNRIIVIPNGTLSNGNIDNYSTMPLRRADFEINVAYGTDADQCIKAILDIVARDSRILSSRDEGASDPFVALSALNESNITFVVRLWVRSSDYWNVKFDMNKAFYTLLPEAGIQFDYPYMNVKITN